MRLELDAIVPAPAFTADADTQARADSADFAEARSSLNQGIKAAQAGNRPQARVSLLLATELDPRNENAWLWLASISEYPEELLGFLNNVLAINPANERALEWKAQTHSLLSRTFVQRGIDASAEGQKEFASECFQTALEHDDRNAVAWMWMASLSELNADKVTLLNRAVALDPENAEAVVALKTAKDGILKDRLRVAKHAAVAGNNAEAIDVLDELLQVDPSSLEAWTMRSHLVEGFEEKIRCFESILAIDPTNVAATAGRDSLLALFGTTMPVISMPAVEPVETLATVEPVETPNDSNVVFADFGPTEYVPTEPAEVEAIEDDYQSAGLYTEPVQAVADPYRPAEPTAVVTDTDQPIEQYNEPWVSVADSHDLTEETNLVAEPAAEEEQNEPHYSYEEPSYSVAEEVEAPVEVASEGDELGTEESPEFAFAQPAAPADEDFAAEGVVSPEHSTVESSDDPEPVASDYGSAVSDYPDDATDPQAETVMFSYPEAADDWNAPSTGSSDARLRSDAEIPMPVVDLPLAPPSYDATPVTFVEPRQAPHPEHESALCAFCGNDNDAQAISCGRCLAVLTLSDLEMLLANPSADKLLVRQAVEEMERYRLARPFNSAELVTLGIGHLNLKNLHLGYDCLSDASRMTPNDVVLAGQVNSLLIRLDEIRQQEEAHLRMPKGKSILVVDDSATVRKLISGKLEKSGHDVICANDGVEAMERLENLVPDLVLLDINMPRMDGYQVCKLIRSNDATKNVAVVMISGKDGFFDKVRGRMAGTTGYITKPFGPETLMKAVEMYLSGEAPDPEVEE